MFMPLEKLDHKELGGKYSGEVAGHPGGCSLALIYSMNLLSYRLHIYPFRGGDKPVHARAINDLSRYIFQDVQVRIFNQPIITYPAKSVSVLLGPSNGTFRNIHCSLLITIYSRARCDSAEVNTKCFGKSQRLY